MAEKYVHTSYVHKWSFCDVAQHWPFGLKLFRKDALKDLWTKSCCKFVICLVTWLQICHLFSYMKSY